MGLTFFPLSAIVVFVREKGRKAPQVKGAIMAWKLDRGTVAMAEAFADRLRDVLIDETVPEHQADWLVGLIELLAQVK